MGRYTYPCPGCWQQQAAEIPNGSAVEHALCPGCEEEANRETDEGKRLRAVIVPRG